MECMCGPESHVNAARAIALEEGAMVRVKATVIASQKGRTEQEESSSRLCLSCKV